MTTIQATFGKQWKLKLASLLAVLAGTSAWVFNQVKDINPAILQDEWIYLVTARLHSPWAQDLPFDYGNYLYNLIYSSTNLCGESFYLCAKGLNLAFIQGFAITLLFIALRFMPFWGALGFYAAVILSPISIYSSMFLPEPLFFFLLGITLLFVLRAADNSNWKSWAAVGFPLALAALVKPHALIAAMAIGLYLLVSGLERKPYLRQALRNATALLGSFIAIRLVFGFVVAGPKGLNPFSAYGAGDAIGVIANDLGSNTSSQAGGSLVGSGIVNGALGLFPLQFYTHTLVAVALVGASIVAIILAMINGFQSSQIRPIHRLATLSAIWLGVLTVAIVLFTGWITGSGDDHTTRVLLRYYDYLFPIVSLAGLAVVVDKELLSQTKNWLRWLIIAPVFILISVAFSGYFGTLTIQIADAPNLAGLVVDKTTFDVTANLTMLTLLMMAFLPRYTIWTFAAMMSWTMVMTGVQIQDQYQGFRMADSAADKAGHYVSSLLMPEERDDLLILAESRFDGRVASFWLEHNTDMELLAPGSEYPVDLLPEGTSYVLAIGNLSMEASEIIAEQEGFKLYKIQN